MTRILRPRYLALLVVAALVVALGVWVGILTHSSPPAQGRVLVLVSVDLPLPQNAASFRGEAVGLRLKPQAQGSSWVDVTVAATPLDLPGQWAAPATDDLFLESVPTGTYGAAELELRSSSGKALNDTQSLVLSVPKNRLTPLLFTFQAPDQAMAAASPQLTASAAFGGQDQVNFGLAVAQGKVMSLPSVPLQNQAGQTVSLSSYRGKVVILASFLSECQETCPLVAAALLQLRRLLQAQHLLQEVQILEVTQDPGDDTPAVLTKYAHYFSLPWPLLTGSDQSIDSFWSALKVPPVQKQSWQGPEPIDQFTGRPEPYNLIHASVVEVVDQEGYVVDELEDQPTLTGSSLPQTIYRYLDAQGRQELKAGGSWTPKTLLGSLTPLLEERGIYTSLPHRNGQVTVGAPAPDFSLPSTAGGNVSLSGQAGHPVLIDFWATWCDNCRADMKLVASTAQRYQAQGVRVLLVDFQQNQAVATKFLRQLHVALPTLLDRKGQVAQDYGVPGLPVAVFINRRGNIAAIQLGQLDQSDLSRDLPLALKS
ncbi:MAG: redoxin domain-containing protein [Candidatus Dormibacteria bacterium]